MLNCRDHSLLRYEALKVKYGQSSEGDELMKTRKPGEISTTIGLQNLSNDSPSLNTGLSNGPAEVSNPGFA